MTELLEIEKWQKLQQDELYAKITVCPASFEPWKQSKTRKIGLTPWVLFLGFLESVVTVGIMKHWAGAFLLTLPRLKYMHFTKKERHPQSVRDGAFPYQQTRL